MGRRPAAHQHALEEGALLGRQLHAGHHGGGEACWLEQPLPRGRGLPRSVGGGGGMPRGNGTQRTPAGGRPGRESRARQDGDRAPPPPPAPRTRRLTAQGKASVDSPGSLLAPAVSPGSGSCPHLSAKPLTCPSRRALFRRTLVVSEASVLDSVNFFSEVTFILFAQLKPCTTQCRLLM